MMGISDRRAQIERWKNERTEPCNGPGCEEKAPCIPWPPVGWYTVVSWQTGGLFCSLRCMANWLAGELAKEESKQP